MTKVEKKQGKADEAFLQDYQPTPEHFDEMLAGDGTVKTHWKTLVDGLTGIGRNEFSQRWRHTGKLLQDHGASFNVFEDSAPKSLRSWHLDPLPLLLSADDWKVLERGVQQRTRLLNLLLKDIYGEQRSIHDGLLPPAVIFGNPHFLRPCHGFLPPRSWYIHLLGVDLFRRKNGSWGVFADRTQKPAGIGEAVENRLFISQMLLDLFHENRVQQLGRFCSALHETLARSSPRNQENPHIVLLTSGPLGKTYLEDAFLARYMGYPLVECGDLTVRNNLVFFKALSGLHPVDVIFRRLNDDLCDPLSIRSDGVIGVPGLLESLRSHKVSMANAPGSSLVETPSLAPFLKQLCRFFLNEDLLLPDPETVWLGNPQDEKRVLENLEAFLIKPAFTKSSKTTISCKQVSDEQKMDLVRKIKARPEEYVAQEEIQLSTVPIWAEGKMARGHLLLRMFAVPSEIPASVMPGGLARLSLSPDFLVHERKSGLHTKDTWFPALDIPAIDGVGRAVEAPVEITRGGKDLQSRVADNFFWLGRYLERLENAIRLSRSVLMRMTEEHEFVSEIELPTLIRLLAKRGIFDPAFAEKTPSENLDLVEAEFQKALFEEKSQEGLKRMFAEVRRVALLVRDRLASDTWRVLRRLEKQFTLAPHQKKLKIPEILELVHDVVFALGAFSGLSMENITRSYDWRFLDMGRRVERALHTLELVQTGLGKARAKERPVMEAILEAADSSMTYRSRYRASLQPAAVIDLLLMDEINPRSVAFQAVAIHQHLERLPTETAQPFLNPEQKSITRILGQLRLTEVHGLSAETPEGERKNLVELIDLLGAEFLALSDHIFRHYFVHVQPSQQLSSLKP